MNVVLAVLVTLTAATTPPRPPGWLGLGYTYHVTNAPAGRIVWLFVQQTAPGGPAERAGLKPQDVITAINGRPLWFSNDVDALNFFGGVKLGQTFVMQVKRGKTLRNVSVTAGKVPPDIARLRKMNQAIAKARQSP